MQIPRGKVTMAFMMMEDGKKVTVCEYTTEYGVQFPDDGEILECDDIHEAVGIQRTTTAKVIQRKVYMTQWVDNETGEPCES